mmetsp:Transcript_66551/g.110659  ORF Transcript_66551/g.110659 Transcript_66551/m.110659 type:complete len:377 (-) Transcript_66551:366-1496(-)
MDNQLWAIAIKKSESQSQLYQATATSCALQTQFELPAAKLRVGTMDSLMSLGDDLTKIDMVAEATAFKLFKTVDDMKKESGGKGEEPKINGVPIPNVVKDWEWDEAKFQLKTPLRELVESIAGRIAGLEEELRTKMAELSAIKAAVTQFERKTQGNLMVRGLDDIVTEEDILETEYMCTIFVVVPRNSYKEFHENYMKMADYVVPLTAKIISEDSEFGLFTVVTFKKSAEQFKTSCREKRYTVREFTFNEAKIESDGKEKDEKIAEYQRLKGLLTSWCTINFAEAFGMTLHLKAIRIFVESCMRYGLSLQSREPNFKAFLLQPKKGKAESLRRDLAKIYTTSSLLDQDDDAAMVPGASGEFYPYVYVPITIDPAQQ